MRQSASPIIQIGGASQDCVHLPCLLGSPNHTRSFAGPAGQGLTVPGPSAFMAMMVDISICCCRKDSSCKKNRLHE